jgi:glycerate kinase
MARDAGVRCFAVAGEVPIDPRSLKAEGIVATASMIEVVGRERAWADAAGALTATTRALVRSRVTEGSDGPRRFFRT